MKKDRVVNFVMSEEDMNQAKFYAWKKRMGLSAFIRNSMTRMIEVTKYEVDGCDFSSLDKDAQIQILVQRISELENKGEQ